MKKYLLQIKIYIAGSLLLYALEVIATSIILFFPGYLIDHYQYGKVFITRIILLYICVFTVYLLIAYLSNRIADYRRIKFERSIKLDYFNAVLNKDYGGYHKYDIGEYLSMQANDITEMCQGYLSPLLSVFRSMMMVISFGIALIVFVDVSIAVVIIIFSVLVVLIPKITAKKLARNNGIFLNGVGKYTSTVKTFFEAHDILDSKGVKKIEAMHETELDSVLSKQMKFRKINSRAMVLNGGAVEFMSIVSFVVIAILLLENRITVGMATVAFTYSTKFMDPIHELNVNIGRIHSVDEIKTKLYKIMNEREEQKPELTDKINEIITVNVKKCFKDVEIMIPDMRFIHSKKYLILGENGAGKSVLFRMLMGFYKPDTGYIAYNGKEDVDTGMFINYVPQQPVIFDATYLENVTIFGTYGAGNLPYYEALFPIDLIKRIRENVDNKNLSGGEKQVVALIRALCSEKPVLLLDEPFAAMNQRAIEEFMKKMNELNRMILVIAHNIDDYKDRFDVVYEVIRKPQSTGKGYVESL